MPAEPPPADLKASKPRGVSIVARDFQTVALYKADGEFAGIRRPGSKKPFEVRLILQSFPFHMQLLICRGLEVQSIVPV